MKKLIAITLILALILPAAALASEEDVVGCWAHYELLADGAPLMTMIYLAADHTSYFITQMFHPDKEGIGRTYIGTWSLNANGTAYVKTGNNTDTTLQFSDTYIGAMDTETFRLYVNISKFD